MRRTILLVLFILPLAAAIDVNQTKAFPTSFSAGQTYASTYEFDSDLNGTYQIFVHVQGVEKDEVSISSSGGDCPLMQGTTDQFRCVKNMGVGVNNAEVNVSLSNNIPPNNLSIFTHFEIPQSNLTPQITAQFINTTKTTQPPPTTTPQTKPQTPTNTTPPPQTPTQNTPPTTPPQTNITQPSPPPTNTPQNNSSTLQMVFHAPQPSNPTFLALLVFGAVFVVGAVVVGVIGWR